MSTLKTRIFATPIVQVQSLVIPLSLNTILESMGTFSLKDSLFIRFLSDCLFLIWLRNS